VLLLAIVVLGVFAGWLANLLLGGGMFPRDWMQLFLAGVIGSFVGGLLASLLAGDGIALRPSGIIGSVIGAVIELAGGQALERRTS
jgi:uncharacterized membrane protein YeaQ/YmgE (transglycosylase-associated protein family)